METADHKNFYKDTFFAVAEKAGEEELCHEIEIISKNPVIDSVIDNVSGLLAVLNKYRQTVSINNSLLRMLGIKNVDEVLGLRPGEVLRCIHCEEAPHGCGTTRYCSTCGAAIAIVTSLESNKPEKQACVMTAEKHGELIDLYLQMQASPITIDGERFILLFIQDVTDDKQRASLERIFFHDISNIVQGLLSSSHLMGFNADEEMKKLADITYKLSVKLSKEIEIQRTLSRLEHSDYKLNVQQDMLNAVVQDIKESVSKHPAAAGKHFRISDIPNIQLNTDFSLLSRILTNMLINAFEAASDQNEVKLSFKQTENSITFCVWNQEAIPKDIALRVFQKNFTTKNEYGRGLGTYVMKLFGERYLGGKVELTSSVSDGTTFSFTLPISIRQ